MLMNALDSSIVNVALPSIQHSLHFSQASLTWVVDAYLIAFGSFLLLAGRLGDLFGRKKIFLSGVTIFTLSSLVCAIASSQSMLIVARFLQGLGGAVDVYKRQRLTPPPRRGSGKCRSNSLTFTGRSDPRRHRPER